MRSAQQSASEPRGMSRAHRSVVAVSGHLQPAELVDVLLVGAADYDVIFVESGARGYSRIKQVTPDLVIVFVEIDDVGACELLSMLKIDSDLSAIPVVTGGTRRKDSGFDDVVAELVEDAWCLTHAFQMN